MSYLDRILDPGTDRESWQVARRPVIGASDAANFAKLESVPRYILAKLRPDFAGNAYTRSGHEWEPRILDWFGVPQNTALIHAEDEKGFASTPDGIEQLPNGDLVLSQVKVFHDTIHTKISPAHRRQMWWEQYTVGASVTKYMWVELVDGVPRRLEPHIVLFERDDLEIQKLLRIARPVLNGVLAARAYEKELTA